MAQTDSREPIFPKGAFGRFLLMLAIVVLPALAFDAVRPEPESAKRNVVMPFELREHAANCILNDDPNSCAIYEAAKPLYPVRPQ